MLRLLQALWAAAAEADDLRGQLSRSQRAADEAALLDDEDAHAWDALVRPFMLDHMPSGRMHSRRSTSSQSASQRHPRCRVLAGGSGVALQVTGCLLYNGNGICYLCSIPACLQAAERAALEAENGDLKAQLAELALRVEAAAEADTAAAAVHIGGDDHGTHSVVPEVMHMHALPLSDHSLS